MACSLASHIVCLEAGLDVVLRRTDLATKRTEGGGDLLRLNPMGQVPTLVCDDGLVLTENPAVLLFLADRAPASQLAPEPNAFARYDILKWLSFVGTEMHKRVNAQIFAIDAPPEPVKDYARLGAAKSLATLESHLSNRKNLVGERFTVADAYLFWALTLFPFGGVSLETYPAVRAYHERHLARDAVRSALRLERSLYGKPLTD